MTVSAHVVSLRWAQAWRAPSLLWRVRRDVRRSQGVVFSVSGRASGGSGRCTINRTLTARRVVAVVEWTSSDAAAVGRSALDESWGSSGAEVWSASLAPLRSKGTWHGVAALGVDAVDADEEASPVASLTCARIRASKLLHFYMLGFPKTARRARAHGTRMLAGVGFGDVPVRDACTFTLWPSAAAVNEFAYANSGVHGPVQQRSKDESWLAESLFARFAVVEHSGRWAGLDPLGESTSASAT